MRGMKARYNYRLRVTPVQARALQEVFDTCRFVWNTALGRWTDLWRHEGVSYDYKEMDAELTDWRGRFDWLAHVPRAPQAQVLRDLDAAIRAFYDPKRPNRRPRFKRKGSYSSAQWAGRTTFKIEGQRLTVSAPGGRITVRMVLSRPLPSTPRSVRIFRDAAGHWWASLPVDVAAEDAPATGETTGLDVGLTTFATTEHPDADVPNPRYARAAAKALARSQRNCARKEKGSNNRAKARRHVARVHARTAAQRSDFQHKQARALARRFDRIGVEDLQVRNMVRNHHLARAIHDASWGDFVFALEWHAAKCGHEIIRYDPRNTTQTCSECGAKAKQRLGLTDRTFACDKCGLVLDRDRNAARNLNPNRRGRPGEGVDGSKTSVPAGSVAARAPEALIAGALPTRHRRGQKELEA